MIIINNNIICDNIPFDKASEFHLTKIYEEVKENKHDNELIEKEPIDVLIKYIDLRDPKLKRDGIHQINKDYDNEELRYSIRSIMKNIPWVRKIFILMPNKKVRFFKEYDLIKDKIIYINDKDFLGYDSSNIDAFLFNYWKLYKYGISNNFIIMDDDCFIGKSLNKNDFFYVQKGKVVPLIITSNFIKIDKESLKMKYDLIRQKAMSSKVEQNGIIFYYKLSSTYLFILDTFNDTLIIPKFTHNAIPVNLKDIKDIYKLVLNSKYKSATLDSLYRHINGLQFQALLLSYTFIKFNKKVKDLPYKYIDIKITVLANYNYSLFCINTGGGNYSLFNYHKAKIVMNYLFPVPTPYENVDYNISNAAFNVVYSMENIINLYKENYRSISKKYAKRNRLQEQALAEQKEYLLFENLLLLVILIIFFKIKKKIVSFLNRLRPYKNLNNFIY